MAAGNPAHHPAATGRAATAPLALVADEEPVTRRALRQLLESAGFQVIEADGGRAVAARMSENVGVVLLDFFMPDVSAMDCLRYLRKHFPDTQVIVLSAPGRAHEAVSVMKEGAMEYVTKPWDREELLIRVRQAARTAALARENRGLKQAVCAPATAAELVGNSPDMRSLRAQIESFAQLDTAILITGAAGTGKTVAAQLIHRSGPRATAPFVSVNCRALPCDSIEPELFGYVRGAFRWASHDRPGRAEIAHGGTLLLDEIGELPMELQPKLLSFLQDCTVQRMGAHTATEVDVRVIAVTSQHLNSICHQGRFCEDLFFRINILSLHMPSVRQRRADVPELAHAILRRIAQRRNCPPPLLGQPAIESLQNYDWPGNVREMEYVLQQAWAASDGQTIRRKDLPANQLRPPEFAAAGTGGVELAGMPLADIERLAVIETLRACGGNKVKTARTLGVSEKTIYNKIKQYNLSGKI